MPYNEKLAKILNKTGHKRGTLIDDILFRLSDQAGDDRMPRAKKITELERLELINYFKKLNEFKN